MEYIYLIQTKEFVDRNEPTYKLGRTSENPPWKRFSGYKLGYIVYILERVYNCVAMENKLLTIFKELFVHRREYGYEMFSGKISDMIRVIHRELENERIYIDNLRLNAAIRRNISKEMKEMDILQKNPPKLLEISDNIDDMSDIPVFQQAVINTFDTNEDILEKLLSDLPEWYIEGSEIEYDTLYSHCAELADYPLSKKLFTQKYENRLFTFGARVKLSSGGKRRNAQMIKLLNPYSANDVE
jgi:hypothetical protein